MARPTTAYLQSSESTNCLLDSTACPDCSLGYCCCLRTSCCAPSSLSLAPPILTTQTSPVFHEYNAPYEYKEPEENFVSIDDIKIKQFLTKIGQQRQQLQEANTTVRHPLKPHKEPKKTTIFSPEYDGSSSMRPVVYEIIELDDEEERKKLKLIKQQAEKSHSKRIADVAVNFAKRQTKCLDISLVPKYADGLNVNDVNERALVSARLSKRSMKTISNQRIVAEIDLLDSSSNSSVADSDNNYAQDKFNEDDDDEESLPLVAAVQCELLCDDNSNESCTQRKMYPKDTRSGVPENNSNNSISLESDGEGNDHEQDNLLIRWDECNDHRERVFFECYLCGKKVQSSYNLRRHMMIHTGERPFNCDLCSRKFREFSDLKKHRRRHAGEVKFLCMVCGEYPPVDNDSTRCINCCTQTKSAVIVAATTVKPAIPPQTEYIPQVTAFNKTTILTKTTTKTKPAICPFTEERTASPTLSQPPRITKRDIHATQTSVETQNFLDNIPAVHRPDYNQLGVITRKEFPCPLCNRAFGSRHNLKRHYMIHTGEKPFSCSQCRKPFREYSTLKKHMVTHQRDRWYKCVRCSHKFRDFLQYSEHKNSHPVDIDDTSDTNPSKRSRSIHDSNHDESSSDDWLECCECSQRFTSVDTYNDHIKQHDLNAQFYECYICKKEFDNQDDLQTHKQLHNNEQQGIS